MRILWEKGTYFLVVVTPKAATNITNTAIDSFKVVPSTSGASTTTTTMTTDSKTCSCSKKTTDYGEKYEVILLDTGIIFDCEEYRVPIFVPVED